MLCSDFNSYEPKKIMLWYRKLKLKRQSKITLEELAVCFLLADLSHNLSNWLNGLWFSITLPRLLRTNLEERQAAVQGCRGDPAWQGGGLRALQGAQGQQGWSIIPQWVPSAVFLFPPQAWLLTSSSCTWWPCGMAMPPGESASLTSCAACCALKPWPVSFGAGAWGRAGDVAAESLERQRAVAGCKGCAARHDNTCLTV